MANKSAARGIAIVLAVCVLLLAGMAISALADQPPLIPAFYSGTVQWEDGSAFTAGELRAYVNGIEAGRIEVVDAAFGTMTVDSDENGINQPVVFSVYSDIPGDAPYVAVSDPDLLWQSGLIVENIVITVYPHPPQVAAVATDSLVTMALGNITPNPGNNSWSIDVIQGTLKDDITGADVALLNLPSGLNTTIEKTDADSILITVFGNAYPSLELSTQVDVIIRGSAVTEAGTLDSLPVPVWIQPTPTLVLDRELVYEAAANNGSITDTISAVLGSGTFAADLSGGVSVFNLPAGLGFTVTRNSDTQLTIAFTGAALSHSQADSLGNLYLVVAMNKINGAMTDIISEQFGIAFDNPPPVLTVTNPVLYEAAANDGSITDTQVVTLANGIFAADLSSGVVVNNLPAGLVAVVTRDSDTQLTIAFTGAAANHGKNDDINNASVTVAQDKIAGAKADVTSDQFAIDFEGPPPTLSLGSLVIAEAAANDGSITDTQVVTLTDGIFAADLSSGVVVNNLPAGLVAVVTRDSDTQLTIAFTGAAANHGKNDDSNNASVTVAQDKIAGAKGDVTSDQFAIDFEGPPPTLSLGSPVLYEAAANDGSITDTQVVTLTDGIFAADLSSGVVVNNLPAGLVAVVTRDSDTQLTIAFTGAALNHADIDDISNASVTIAQDKIDGAKGDVTTGQFAIDFEDPPIPESSRVGVMVFDGTASMMPGNTTVLSTDRTWVLRVIRGTVKSGVNASNLELVGLPSGLTVGVVKGSKNSIVISLSGQTAAPLTESAQVMAIVRSSAVTQSELLDSSPVYLLLMPDPPPAPALLATPQLLTEDSSNDGRIAGELLVKVKNGLFAADLDGGVVVNNLPAGLGINVLRDNDTQIRISFIGKALNHSNLDDVGNASVTVQPAQIIGAAQNVTSNWFGFDFSNAPQPNPNIEITTNTIHETANNDGSVLESQVVVLHNGIFAEDMSGGVLVNNLPAGLSMNIIRNSSNQLTLFFTGRALNHAQADSVANAWVSILASKVVGAAADLQSGLFRFEFTDPAPLPIPGKISAYAFDGTATMAAGNQSVSPADRTWVLRLSSGTVRSGVNTGNLIISGLPAGLTATAVKGSMNSIVVSLGGTAAEPLTEEITVNIVIKASAVTQSYFEDSDSIPVKLRVAPAA